MEISTLTIIILWVIGVAASVATSLVWRSEFFDSDEKIKYLLKMAGISLCLSWIFFVAQVIFIIVLWYTFNKSNNIG